MKLQEILKEASIYKFDRSLEIKDKANRKLFLDRWPIEKIKTMTKEEYFGLDKDSFCYWLEFKDILAGAGGGNASKFGIYKSKESGKYIKGVGKNRIELSDSEADAELGKIKKTILDGIDLAKEERIEEIESMENPIWDMILLKIFTIYAQHNFLTVLSKPVLLEAAKSLELQSPEVLKEYSCIGLNFLVNKKIGILHETKEWSNSKRGTFLWTIFKDVLNIRTGRNRRRQMGIVAFYLSKFGDNFKNKRFQGKSWREIYTLFANNLGSPDKIESFCNTLKNLRDSFDGYHNNERQGWKEKDGSPKKLNKSLQQVYDKYQSYSESELWKKVSKYISENFAELEAEESSDYEFPLNQIIYGPPGTGKTYSVVEKALKIIDGEAFDDLSGFEKHAECLARFNELKKNGNIDFITFHQSYSYEEFIEGITPKVNDDGSISYEVKPGVFKSFINKSKNKKAKVKFSEISDNPTVWRISLKKKNNPNYFDDCLEAGLIGIDFNVDANFEEIDFDDHFDKDNIPGKTSLNMFVNEMTNGDVVCVFNSATSIKAIGIITSDYKHNSIKKNLHMHTRKVNWIDNNVRDIYELNGNKKMMTPTIHRLPNINPSSLLDLVTDMKTKNASNDELNDKFVFIIDEINCGNISKIFGELITLLEKDKREGNGGFPLKLPYSQEDFIIPENIHIIGTMNTSDRSIAMIDVALRRRFVFEEFMPKMNLIKEFVEDVPVRKIIQTLNDKISILYGRDYQIGHSYFMDKNLKTIDDLKQVWFYNIIPLLSEYFYEEWDKLNAIVAPFIKIERKVKGLEKLHLQTTNLYSFKNISMSNSEFVKLMKQIDAIELDNNDELEDVA